MRDADGRKRRVVATFVMTMAIVVSPALGAVAANDARSSGHTREEIHAYKDSNPGAFAWYRANDLRHNAGHHAHHHGVTRRTPV